MATTLQTQVFKIGPIRTPVLTTLMPGTGPVPEAMLFVHGNPGLRLDWQELAQLAGGFMPVLAPDMPGFGAADKPANFPYSVQAGAGFLEQLRNLLQIEKLHLVLHDFGGPWGLQWAADHRDRVASVTLINTGILPGYRWHTLAQLWRTPLLGELLQRVTTYGGFRLALNRGNPRPLPESFLRQLYSHYDEGTRRAVLQLYRATAEPGRDSLVLGMALRPLDLPALVLWGDADPYLPAKFALHQQEVFPRARIVRIAGAGHWPFVDFPELVAGELRDFLRVLRTQPTSAASP